MTVEQNPQKKRTHSDGLIRRQYPKGLQVGTKTLKHYYGICTMD